jgi:serine protease Do
VIPGFSDPFSAKLVGADSQTDIAVLKVESSEPFQFVTLGDSDMLQVGELAVAIGNPFGELAGTVTVGVISALDRELMIASSKYNLLQTDASINSGNSGGPLVNSYGEVIGVTNAKISGGEGIGFAIPINDVKNIIEELINLGYVSGRPVMGVMVVEVDSETAEQYGWPVGVYVREVTAGGPAEKAGILVRDIITEINGEMIVSSQSVLDIRDELGIGEEMELTVFRDGEVLTLTLVLEEGKAS